MTGVVYADTTDAQLDVALSRIQKTRDIPNYLDTAITGWFADWDGAEADLAGALWRYTHTKNAPRCLVIAANRWMAPR